MKLSSFRFHHLHVAIHCISSVVEQVGKYFDHKTRDLKMITFMGILLDGKVFSLNHKFLLLFMAMTFI